MPDVDFSLPARRVICALDRAIEERGKPQRILMDNGPEFTSRALDARGSVKRPMRRR